MITDHDRACMIIGNAVPTTGHKTLHPWEVANLLREEGLLLERDITSRRSWFKIAPSTWVLFWPPSCGLDWHDHGESWARFWVVSGELHETIRDQGHEFPWLLRAEHGVQLREPGSVHRLVNIGTTMAVSVHTYDPELVVAYDEALEIRPER